jgi:hypothetical protein
MTSLLLSGYQELFLWEKATKMPSTHIHLVLRSGVGGAVPPFPDMPSWHAQGQPYLHLKKKTEKLTSCMLV